MMSLPLTTGYAIRALGWLERAKPGKRVLAKQIASKTGIPRPYLSKVLHQLAQSGLIHAKRGYRGGFWLSRPATNISVLEVVEAMEGRSQTPFCMLGVSACSDLRHCPTHDFWAREWSKIERELRRVSLAEVANFERRVCGGYKGFRYDSAPRSNGHKPAKPAKKA